MNDPYPSDRYPSAASFRGPDTLRAVSTKLFTYDPRERSFIAELSDLSGLPYLHPVYDDAIDTGLTLRSHKTGKFVTFVETRREHDREGDLVAIHYLSVTKTQAENPRLHLVLLND